MDETLSRRRVRRSVEVICRGWRHVHEVFSRRRVKEVSRGDL